MEKTRLLRHLTAARGQTVLGWFGSWQNVGQRLLESLRNGAWPEERFTQPVGKAMRIVLDSL